MPDEPRALPAKPPGIVSVLREALLQGHGPRMSVGELVQALGPRGYGAMILVLDLPNLIPLPIPGPSALFGLPMALLAIQMAFGAEAPWLPQGIRRRMFNRAHLMSLCARIEPFLRHVERVLRPRWSGFSGRLADRFLGAFIALLAAVMSLPIPFGNLILAVPIGFVALGLIARDGVAILGGLVFGVIALIVNVLIGSSLILGGVYALHRFFGG